MKKSRIVAVIFLLLFSLIAAAYICFQPDKSYSIGSGTVSYSGITIAPGETGEVKIKLTNASNVQAVGGYFNVQDTSCIEIVKVAKAPSVSYNDGNHKFALVGMDELPSPSLILTVTVKGLKECSTKLVFSDVVVTSTESTKSVAGTSPGIITVKKPAPTTTTTTTTHAVQTTNNNTTQNSGNNTKTTKSTTTKVTTTKSGSNNNYLSGLSVEGYSIPFNKNVNDYAITVAEEVESVTVNAKTDDGKATFKVVGGNSLVNGHNDVKVIVEAENGSTRTYTIDVFREGEVKGAEDEKSSDSTLSSIKPSIGSISPAFNSNVTKYIMYLPYEDSKISFNATPSNAKSSVEIDTIDELDIGKNVFNIKVKSESGSETVYTIYVMRGINPEYLDSNNNLLKQIDITNGNLLGTFDKNNREYFYNKKAGFSINPVPEDENAIVDIYTYKDVINIKVEAPNGDVAIYTLRPYKFIYSIWFYFILILIGFILGLFFKKIVKKLCK